MSKLAVTLVSGNNRKIEEAHASFVKHGLALEVAQLDIDEIQHHDPTKITEAKAREAYQQLQKPVLVNDSSWSIPALGGFPGGYMKDVSGWFAPEDFLALMLGKADRTIQLIDVTCYCDASQCKTFVYTGWKGEFVDTPRGVSGPSINKVVQQVGGTMTISERWDERDAGQANGKDKVFEAWEQVARWLKEKANE